MLFAPFIRALEPRNDTATSEAATSVIGGPFALNSGTSFFSKLADPENDHRDKEADAGAERAFDKGLEIAERRVRPRPFRGRAS